MAAAAERATIKPLLPNWLLEIWREHILPPMMEAAHNRPLEATRETR
jgi:hypothetical protein